MSSSADTGRIYLVTGAAGHLGSNIVWLLSQRGEKVRALVLPGEKNIPQGSGIEIFRGDVCDPGSLFPFFNCESCGDVYVIHCAGIVSISSGYDSRVYSVNVTGTKNVTDLCLKNNVKRMVYVSSVHAIKELPRGETIRETDTFSPELVHGLYAKTKAEATAYVLAAVKRGLHASVVHPSGICGPGDNGRGHITALVTDFCRGRLTAMPRGGYDFVDVRDVAAGTVSCCEHGQDGGCYILSGHYLMIPELLGELSEVTGHKPIKTVLPLWFVKLTAPLAEGWYKMLNHPPLYTAYSIYTLNTNAAFSCAKAVKELGYNSRPMKDTLSDTVAWLRERGRI